MHCKVLYTRIIDALHFKPYIYWHTISVPLYCGNNMAGRSLIYTRLKVSFLPLRLGVLLMFSHVGGKLGIVILLCACGVGGGDLNAENEGHF